MESNCDHNNACQRGTTSSNNDSWDIGSSSIKRDHAADNPILINTAQPIIDMMAASAAATLQNMPKPLLHENNMTVRLRLNFPSADGNSFTEELTERDLHTDILNNTDNRQPERKNSKLLTEGLLRAMRTAPVTYEASDEFDDTFPDNINPWMLESERRDSIEQTRKKLAVKMSGAAKSKNQRNRRGLRESRRSTGVAVFDEMSSPLYQNDDEETAQQTRKNTIQNEKPVYHQLMLQNQIPVSTERKNFDQPYVEQSERLEQDLENASSEEPMRADNIPMQSISGSQMPESQNGPSDLYAQLETELDALIKGLQTASSG